MYTLYFHCAEFRHLKSNTEGYCGNTSLQIVERGYAIRRLWYVYHWKISLARKADMINYTAMASSTDFHLFFHLPHAYHLIFKDDVSESQENQCILRLFQITAKKQGAKSKKYPVVMSHWKDNVIIVKAMPSTTADPVNTKISPSQVPLKRWVKFLYKYTGRHGLLW